MVTGRFNSHFRDCLLLQADEGVWAGDKAAEGKLKDLITNDYQWVEPKGIDPFRVRNCTRLLVTGNPSWVVPAALEERRFAVYEIGEERLQDREYFGELLDQLDNGGREALLYYLQNFDLNCVDIGVVPKTESLFEQKLESLDDVQSWWYEKLQEGRLLRDHECWKPNEVPVDLLHEEFLEFCRNKGSRFKRTRESFGRGLSGLLPPDFPKRQQNKKYSYFERGNPDAITATGSLYYFPSLEVCQQTFSEKLNWDVDWPD